MIKNHQPALKLGAVFTFALLIAGCAPLSLQSALQDAEATAAAAEQAQADAQRAIEIATAAQSTANQALSLATANQAAIEQLNRRLEEGLAAGVIK